MKHFDKPGVYIIGSGQLKMEKVSPFSLRQMGAHSIRQAMADAGLEKVDAIYLGNMLSGLVSNQMQLGPIVASAAGLNGTESVTLEAACGSGGAALRHGYMAIMSGMCDTVAICGLEIMSQTENITRILATGSDWESEGSKGASFVSLNARLMQMYIDRYKISTESFANFGINAHHNANLNPNALFHKEITLKDYIDAKFLYESLRIYDSSPICDGSATLILSKHPPTANSGRPHVKITASASSTEFVGLADRTDPLAGEGIAKSGAKAFKMAGISQSDVDFFELHDAYSIIATMSLEAMGFAKPGEGWKMAHESHITHNGKLPISTFGGLKARGHPIGASGVYQAAEAYLQLTHNGGANQLKKDLRLGLIQSIGGTASSVFTHVLVNNT